MNNNIFSSQRFVDTAALINKELQPSSKVIEVGSNDASFKQFLRQMSNTNWKTVDKYGSPDVITDLDGKQAKLPFDDNSIDLVICTEVLEHLPLGTYLVKEISRVLKDTGSAIISVPNIVSLRSRVRVLLGLLPRNAASGDCGHPLGGTGYLIDGDWVGSHVVDFNPSRFFGYLNRGKLKIKTHVRSSIEFRFKNKIFLNLPASFVPKNLSDFIIVIAGKK